MHTRGKIRSALLQQTPLSCRYQGLLEQTLTREFFHLVRFCPERMISKDDGELTVESALLLVTRPNRLT